MAGTPFLGNTLALSEYLSSINASPMNSVGATDAISRAGTIITGVTSGSDLDVLNAVKTQINNLETILTTTAPTLDMLDDPANFNQYSMTGVAIAFANNGVALQHNIVRRDPIIAGLYELDLSAINIDDIEIPFFPIEFAAPTATTSFERYPKPRYIYDANVANTAAVTTTPVIPHTVPVGVGPMSTDLKVKITSKSSSIYFTGVPGAVTTPFVESYNGINLHADSNYTQGVAGVDVFSFTATGAATGTQHSMTYLVSYDSSVLTNVLAAVDLFNFPFSYMTLLSSQLNTPLVGVGVASLNTLVKRIIRASADTLGVTQNVTQAGLTALTNPAANIFDPAYLDAVTRGKITFPLVPTVAHTLFAQQVTKLVMLAKMMGVIKLM